MPLAHLRQRSDPCRNHSVIHKPASLRERQHVLAEIDAATNGGTVKQTSARASGWLLTRIAGHS